MHTQCDTNTGDRNVHLLHYQLYDYTHVLDTQEEVYQMVHNTATNKQNPLLKKICTLRMYIYETVLVSLNVCVCMSQQLGSEVERQGKANKSTTPRTALSFQRKEEELPWVGFEPTTLCSLGERSTNQGNSAGRGNTTQGKPQTTVLWHSKLSMFMSHSMVCTTTSV